MFQRLTEIYERKKKTIRQLNRTAIDYLATVYAGIADKKNLREIHKDIRNITLKARNDGKPINPSAERYAMRLAKSARKKVNAGALIPSADAVFKMFDERKVFQDMKKTTYTLARKNEAKEKDALLSESIAENKKLLIKIDWGKHRKVDDPKIEQVKLFYLASSHNDCAKDHLSSQGKIYIDENWKNLIKDKELHDKIESYVSKNNVKTMQWVIGKPVWFITRPNCRHYFKQLSPDKVLDFTAEQLVEKYKMHRAIGRREDFQTISHPMRKDWYTIENVQSIINQYKERLLYHEKLYEAKKSDLIKMAIEKDKLLIQKWEDFLKTLA